MDVHALAWRCRRFEVLSAVEVDAIYRARQMAFVVEQDCVYLDADGCDPDCLHLTAHDAASTLPLAYARLLPPGMKYVEASIGRVLTLGRGRGVGLGRELMRRALAETTTAFPGHCVRIAAQARLEKFYNDFGFVADKPPHIEDGIPHVEMLRPAGDDPSAHRLPTISPA